jgi:hypothetical protein
LKPVKGKVYITPHLHYGQIYTMGGDVAGTDVHTGPDHWRERFKGNGYLFTVKGEHLTHIQPDEDDVGAMASKPDAPWWLKNRFDQLHPRTQQKMRWGELAYHASGGKQILRRLADFEKLDLIDRGASVAHDGPLPIDQAWRLDKKKIHLLQKDGSNFFDVAERVR